MNRFFKSNLDLVLVIAVIAILLILFAPIPPALLDLLIMINFSLALTILLLTFYVERPVAFSTFPSLLLVATLFRLSLNVAATRLILTEASAGDVIGAIGTFAVQGNFVIGLVVFFILTVVQYVVVTSGAQRVSEVAARFVLDSVPGQQMSIDADLNMGLIDQPEAKKRRKDLEREAAFYGSMDGASKFVKGDAIAGIIILLINIIAGWIIGVMQLNMAWDEALSTFTLLTIGDGIVTQVPALIIAVATGIIVTRSSADRQLSVEIFEQLSSVPRIPLIVLATVLLLLLLPGMPKWPIAILAVAAIAVFIAIRRKAVDTEEPLLQETSDVAAQIAGRSVPAIEVILGHELGDRWQGLKPMLADRIVALRDQIEKQSGFVIPAVMFHDGPEIAPLAYEIHLHGARYGQAVIHPDLTLAVRSSESDSTKLSGIETRDPAFGLPALWVDDAQAEISRRAGLTLVDPVTVLLAHLTEIVKAQCAALLTRAEVVVLLEGVRSRQPGLIEELIPAILTVSDIQRVLQNLMEEQVSIRNLDQIAEVLVDSGRQTKDLAELVEKVRQRLSHSICEKLRGNQDQLSVISLDPRTEAKFADAVRQGEPAGPLLDPRFAEQLIRRLLPSVEKMIRNGANPVLLCGPEIRKHLRSFLRRTAPQLSILSVNEIPHTVDLASFAIVKVDDD